MKEKRNQCPHVFYTKVSPKIKGNQRNSWQNAATNSIMQQSIEYNLLLR